MDRGPEPLNRDPWRRRGDGELLEVKRLLVVKGRSLRHDVTAVHQLGENEAEGQEKRGWQEGLRLE